MLSLSAPLTGTRLGKYGLLGKLASGGMGELYLAELEGAADFRKLVVIKRLLPHLADNPDFEALFFNEARISALLSHPNLCHVFELGSDRGEHYIAMEYLEGASLHELLLDRRGGLFPEAWTPRLFASLIYQIAEGLHHVHAMVGPAGEPLGIVHRDISPTNLFVTVDGVAKVLDFGVAKMRAYLEDGEHSSLKGKFAYMAPEQLRGEPLDRRADVFSVGAVLFEGLAGRRLFDQKSHALIAQAILDGAIPRLRAVRPDLPPVLDGIVARAVAFEREARYPTARDLGEALLDAVGGAVLPPGRIADVLGEALKTRAVDRRKVALAAAAAATAATEVSPPEVEPPPAEPQAPIIERSTPVERPSPAIERPTALPPSAGAVPPGTGGAAVATARGRLRRAGLLTVALGLLGAVIALAQVSRGKHAEQSSARPGESAALVESAGTTPSSPRAGAGSAADAGHEEPGAERAAADVAASAAPDPDSHPDSDLDRDVDTAAGTGTGPDRAPARSRRRGSRSGERAATRPRTPGYLSLDSEPYATVYIDGRRAGDTPLYRVEVAPGRRRVRFVLPGGRSQTVEVVVRPGEGTSRRVHW